MTDSWLHEDWLNSKAGSVDAELWDRRLLGRPVSEDDGCDEYIDPRSSEAAEAAMARAEWMENR